MDKQAKNYVESFMAEVIAKNPGEKEFHQAVREVVESVAPYILSHPYLLDQKIMERIVEPERMIMFRVPWMDDQGEIHVNRGFRVQMNSAIGPYKGGVRFHSSVNLSIMKFLAFEQTFKNSLTTLPMGGAKGGSDFSPRGKSDAEVMRFCQSFMNELYRHIGPDTDVPAGDIGVGAREIGYLYGMYKKLARENTGVLTGKGLTYGGSRIRPEATGFGALYFLTQMLETAGDSIKGKTIAISGFGNVAWGAATKATQLGAKVVTISGPDGYIYDADGLNEEKIAYMLQLRASNNDVVEPYARKFGAEFISLIKKYVEENDITRPDDFVMKSAPSKSEIKRFIIRSIDARMSLEDIAEARGLDMEELMSEIEKIVATGTKLNLDYYIREELDDEIVSDIYDYFKNDAASDSVAEAMEKLGDDYYEIEVRLVRIKFLCEIAS